MINKSRMQEIEELDLFIRSKQENIDSVLSSLGWKEESLKDDVKVSCPINPEHWVPESALLQHKELCEWVTKGYVKEDFLKPPDSSFFYEKSANVVPVLIDQPTQERILLECGLNAAGKDRKDFPKTMDRCTTQLTPEQRAALYDFVVNASKTAEKPKDVTLEELMIDFEMKDDHDNKPKSKIEILAEMRDYKRRRQSYRAKNVHITKKSYTEIMKEVIENQISYLIETKKLENSENSQKDSGEDSNDDRKNSSKEGNDLKRKYGHSMDYYDTPEDSSYKAKSYYSEDERDDDESRKHHSKHKSRHHSPKRKKHKRDRSRSRSPSYHKHKKSHKHKRSHN